MEQEENLELSTTEETADVSPSDEQFSDEDIYNALDEDNDRQAEDKADDLDADEEQPQDNEQKVDEPDKSLDVTNSKDNSQKTDCPDKFLNENGEPDVQKILTSYKELEQYNTQKIQELNKELESIKQNAQAEQQKMAEDYGYSTVEDFEIALNVANHVAQNYMNRINSSYDKEYVRELLYSYNNNPNAETLREIEEQFDLETVKEVHSDSTLYAFQLQQEVAQRKYEEENVRLREEATNYVQNAVNSYPEWFEVKEFVDFFGDALKTKGDSFDAGAFIGHIQNLKTYFRNELLNELKQNNSNKNAIDELIQRTPSTKNIGSKDVSLKDSDEAIISEITKFV